MSIALPLRVTPDGKLVEQDSFEAVLGLIKVMAGTTSTTWPHVRWFGLYEAFSEAATREKQDHEGLKDSLNTALREVGVTAYVVQAVTTDVIDGTGRRGFRMTITDESGQARFGQVAAL